MGRKTAQALALGLLVAGRAGGQSVNVWPGAAPGSETWTQKETSIDDTPVGSVVFHMVTPTLTAYLPDKAKATGTGVLIAPGGAFVALAIDLEGRKVASLAPGKRRRRVRAQVRIMETRGEGIPKGMDMYAAAAEIADNHVRPVASTEGPMPRTKSDLAERARPAGREGQAAISRRQMLERVALGAAAGWASSLQSGRAWSQPARPASLRWIATTRERPWRDQPAPPVSSSQERWDVSVLIDQRLQPIEGFGACFNELGWVALSALSSDDRNAVLRELFAPGVGASLRVCRMPVGANDFSRDWYSYDEIPDDFELRGFSIANDLETLVPFIRAAKAHQPRLALWASPWSPPTWMKRNRHYATSPSRPGQPPNGLKPDQVGTEGQDMFIQEERYLAAYGRYFARFVEEYRRQGIEIGMVMPQNEFNSNQPFPSCCWSPEGLARFIPFLGAAMEPLGVDVFLGTMERPDHALLTPALTDPRSRKHIKGIGVQWAGKHALQRLHQDHPELKLYATEQECGDGANDWRYCRYAWTLMRKYFEGGVNAYDYWNIALEKGGLSRWGWAQNSLVTVDPAVKTYRYNHEYYLLKHLSHFVQAGAHRLALQGWSGYENLLAFSNPDGSVVVVTQNDMCEEMPIRVRVGASVLTATLPADSFNTFLVPPA